MNGDLTPDEQALALATKRAIQAAGGLDTCERETGISDTQLSRCCSPNHRDSITIRDAATIEAIAHGRAGHPHILRALARQLGFVVVKPPVVDHAAESLLQSVIELTAELGDVANSIRDALKDGKTESDEATAALEQLDDLDQASARLRMKLKAIARGDKAALRSVA